MRFLIVAALLGSLSVPAVARECPDVPGWSKPARHMSARLPRMRFALEPDSAAQLGLHVQRSVVLATREGKSGWMDRYAGLAAIDVKRPGKLDIAMSNRAFVDLVRDGRTLQSTDHRRANCSGIFKIVSFDVEPGRYIVQVTGSQAPSIRLAAIQR